MLRAVITIFKSQLVNKPLEKWLHLYDVVSDVDDVIVVKAKTGKLFDFLQVLKENGIDYGTHFNTSG